MILNRIQKLGANSPLRAFLQRRIEARLLASFGLPPQNSLALEIGCGRGIGSHLLVERFGAGRVIAVDLDPEMIALARAHVRGQAGKKIDFRVADATRLELSSDSVDSVFDFQMLHHAGAWPEVLSEVARVLRPGGSFYFSELCAGVLNQPLVERLFHPPGESAFTASQLETEIEARGLLLEGRVKRFGQALVMGCARKAERKG